MRENSLTVVGNVVAPPVRNRTAGGSVTNFRLASTARRFDKESQSWGDGKRLFIDVECWDELSGNVAHSVSKGDPVIVRGELFTHEWETDQGRRSAPRIRAEAVGLDLARGTVEFRRSARSSAASEVPDDASALAAAGEEFGGVVDPETGELVTAADGEEQRSDAAPEYDLVSD